MKQRSPDSRYSNFFVSFSLVRLTRSALSNTFCREEIWRSGAVRLDIRGARAVVVKKTPIRILHHRGLSNLRLRLPSISAPKGLPQRKHAPVRHNHFLTFLASRFRVDPRRGRIIFFTFYLIFFFLFLARGLRFITMDNSQSAETWGVEVEQGLKKTATKAEERSL